MNGALLAAVDSAEFTAVPVMLAPFFAALVALTALAVRALAAKDARRLLRQADERTDFYRHLIRCVHLGQPLSPEQRREFEYLTRPATPIHSTTPESGTP